MEKQDWSEKAKKVIRFGWAAIIILSSAIGYAAFNHWHGGGNLTIQNAKVTGTMVAARSLVEGKVKELPFEDGADVKTGDVIAKLEVKITDGEIKQLEEAVKLAKANYERLKEGQIVRVPVTKPAPAPKFPGRATSGSLEERYQRMNELYKMGAISAKQRDEAQRAYEAAKSAGLPTNAPANSIPSQVVEYVEQWQPTPPDVLANAENVIKQAELSLNVAIEFSRETDITAPVDGVIYYVAEKDKDLTAGNVVAKVGDLRELWLEAEVSESEFNKIPLGKPVNYSIGGKNYLGTVTEKIAPTKTEGEENSDDSAPVQDKYIIKVSLPDEETFTPNTLTTLKMRF